MQKLFANAQALEQELSWLGRVLDARFQIHFQPTATEPPSILELGPPDQQNSESEYARFINHYQMSFVERLALIMSMVPHIRPQLFDNFFLRNQTSDRRYTEFGGGARADGEFIPTGETLAFVLAGTDLAMRFGAQAIFHPQHFFTRHRILRFMSPTGEDVPPMKAQLQISDEVLSLLTTGEQRAPSFGANFPATLIETPLNWEDVVLPTSTRKQIEEIQAWMEFGSILMNDWGMAAKLRPGYRTLFYGPPGTGKTMTACLLGKAAGREVYKVDLSLVVSKYIGETEKNLAKVFDQAEHKGWLLFFDEADALFGKRGDTKDAHDRYANQEVAFLLQRIETFDGIAILASNLRNNVDDAFARRFESVIYFPMPRPEERLRLWRQGFSPKAQLDTNVDLEKLARDHSLTGGAIMNVIRFASLNAVKDQRAILSEDLLIGIQREYAKEGKAG